MLLPKYNFLEKMNCDVGYTKMERRLTAIALVLMAKQEHAQKQTIVKGNELIVPMKYVHINLTYCRVQGYRKGSKSFIHNRKPGPLQDISNLFGFEANTEIRLIFGDNKIYIFALAHMQLAKSGNPDLSDELALEIFTAVKREVPDLIVEYLD
jgi:hypothetical protein